VSAGAVPASSPETLAPGTYYWQASYGGEGANEPSASTCGAEVETVTPALVSEGPAVDGEAFSQAYDSATSHISTTQSGDLILAFVACDGPRSGGQTSQVKGGGLKWSLVKRENRALGDAEVWEARATGVLTKAGITAKVKKGHFDETLDVVAFKNATGLGAVAGFENKKGAPHGKLMTTSGNSWVWALGDDWLASIPRTVGPNQKLVHQAFDSVGDTYWVQSTDRVTPAAGTEVEINDTAPKADPYNMILVEVLSPSTATPTPNLKPRLTRAQELEQALKACKKEKKKIQRLACERQARRIYGSKKT
jgi:hypothetical protein